MTPQQPNENAQKCGVRLQPRDRFESFHPQTCGRPVAEVIDGEALCKRHATAKRKREQRFAAEDQERAEIKEFQENIAAVADSYGIDVRAEYDSIRGRYRRDRVSIGYDDFQRLVENKPHLNDATPDEAGATRPSGQSSTDKPIG